MHKVPEGPIMFLRHGETEWNVDGRYQGHTNTTLTENGRAQARKCASNIQNICSERCLAHENMNIFHSPLARARETADIIADKLKIDPVSLINVKHLQELSMGRWEGLNSQQVKDQFYSERQSRKTNRWDFKPLGGESLSEREQGLSTWLSTVPPNSIIVTHSGILRIIHALLTPMSRSESSVLSIGHAEIWLWVCDKLHT